MNTFKPDNIREKITHETTKSQVKNSITSRHYDKRGVVTNTNNIILYINEIDMP